ncbi:hypothetical protein BC835DRAFT_1017764 [Cytidiella melzeri]|nr:hypothetical protein BC835DRAFT_1017764 [Cytidiella melzeri]
MASDDEKEITRELNIQIHAIRAAPKGSEKTVSQERELLKRMIGLVSSPYITVKIVVARHIPVYIKSFEDLEDDAINAVYDLCEDQESTVRMEGYRAITQISTFFPKHVKRNADVLVQLLQSDERREVLIVSRQLLLHLDLDPAVTLNVLCDQIVPPEVPVDEEDQAVRDRLRSLVIEFMRGMAAKGSILRHSTKSELGPDTVLVNRVMSAISRLSPSDGDILFKDIILDLPAYEEGSQRSRDLLRNLVEEAESCYRSEAGEDSDNTSLTHTRHLMSLAAIVAVQRRLTSSVPIVQFWCPNKISTAMLGRLSEDLQLFVFDNVLNAYGELSSDALQTKDFKAIRTSLVDALTPLLSRFVTAQGSAHRVWSAYKALLTVYKQHAAETKWQVPPSLMTTLRDLQAQAEEITNLSDEEKEQKTCLRQVQDLTLSLLDSSTASAPASSNSKGISSHIHKNNAGPVHINHQVRRRRRQHVKWLPPFRQAHAQETLGKSSNQHHSQDDRTQYPRQLRVWPETLPSSTRRLAHKALCLLS